MTPVACYLRSLELLLLRSLGDLCVTFRPHFPAKHSHFPHFPSDDAVSYDLPLSGSWHPSPPWFLSISLAPRITSGHILTSKDLELGPPHTER